MGEPSESLLPVTLLCGFLGAGKTTLLKHILETKHSDNNDFKCAVIVNDVAELNIDKSLIDQSALVQSDEVIAMQNGCVCCTLQNDLVEQITKLAASGSFDYMIIEASGVSEPSHIAKQFGDCEDEHDHDEHKEKSLGECARLDTCVTVVDAAEFLGNLETVKEGPSQESLAQLLVEQIEYANVVILNKTDLVDKAQLETIQQQLMVLNPKAKVLTSLNSTIDVKEVVGTSLYDSKDFAVVPDDLVEEAEPACCTAKRVAGETPCCKRARTFESGLSTVVLASKQASKGTRHTARFGFNSFVYRARRPFHPERFKTMAKTYFIYLNPEAGGEEEEVEEGEEEGEEGEEEEQLDLSTLDRTSPEAFDALLASHKALQTRFMELTGECEEDGEAEDDNGEAARARLELAKEREEVRTPKFGMLLRSKGFVWLADAHDLMLTLGHAGNMMTLKTSGKWNVLNPKAWSGSSSEEQAALREDWVGPFGDRRQELVFIGKELKHKEIQTIFDECLLTDEEMALGIDGWKATIGDCLLEQVEQ